MTCKQEKRPTTTCFKNRQRCVDDLLRVARRSRCIQSGRQIQQRLACVIKGTIKAYARRVTQAHAFREVRKVIANSKRRRSKYPSPRMLLDECAKLIRNIDGHVMQGYAVRPDRKSTRLN